MVRQVLLNWVVWCKRWCGNDELRMGRLPPSYTDPTLMQLLWKFLTTLAGNDKEQVYLVPSR
jgi:hypothetical protein